MALMELVVIARCAEAKGSANLLKQLAITAFKNQGLQIILGNVRDLKVLGDRILSKQIKGNDGRKHLVGRYLQILFDGNLDCKQALEKTAKQSYETLRQLHQIRFSTHKIQDFTLDAQFYNRTLEEHRLVVDNTQSQKEYYNKLYEMANKNKSNHA